MKRESERKEESKERRGRKIKKNGSKINAQE